jgi:hypothetical protein
LVKEGISPQRLSLRSDNLNSVGEGYIEDDFRQLVLNIEVMPALIGGLSEPEDRRDSGLVRPLSGGALPCIRARRISLA